MNYDSITDFPFHYHLQTRWKDMDSFGHVNNAVFFTYIEDARITLFKRWNIIDKNKSIIVASVKIDFLSQVKHQSDLVIGQSISSIGKSSFDIHSTIYLKDAPKPKPLASAVVTCVCYDYERNKTVPVYDEIKAEYSG